MIIYTDPETGNVCSCSKASSVPEGVTWYEVAPPSDKEFRDAWKINAGQLVIDTTIANALFIKKATDTLQQVVDEFAQSWGYDDINSIAKYSARGSSPFKAEADVLGNYADAVWVYGLGVLAAWEAGGAKPTIESILAGLPAQPIKP